MIPEIGAYDLTMTGEQPSQTWRLDVENGRVLGTLYGLEAIKQAVGKVLITERYRHEIYTFDYGHDLTDLIGKPSLYVQSEVVRMIREALLQDDRIQEIENILTEVVGDWFHIRFTVVSSFGRFDYHQEVIRNV